jgi:hypothetical protein
LALEIKNCPSFMVDSHLHTRTHAHDTSYKTPKCSLKKRKDDRKRNRRATSSGSPGEETAPDEIEYDGDTVYMDVMKIPAENRVFCSSRPDP